MNTAIEIKDLSFSFNVEPVLEHINLSLEKGDFLGLIGPNGGGKTTLIRLILGVLKPTAGTVALLGRGPLEARERAGYIPQEVSMNMDFPISVRDVVRMGLTRKRGLCRYYTAADKKRANQVLAELGLSSLAGRQIGSLSGGQRQKVLLARALVAEPEILFLDEPTASIDATGQNEIYEYLKQLNGNGTTIIITTHNVGAISTYIKSIACVNRYFHFHPDGKLDEDIVQQAFGCPVDIIAHGMPHRVLHSH